MKKSLSHQEMVVAFKAATCSYSGAMKRWRERAKTGLTDSDLRALLKYELGIAGGSCGYADRPAIQYQGADLKIWASWEWPNTNTSDPIFSGQSTINMARYVYGIREPNDKQLALL